MSSAAKALELLSYFSIAEPEIGLSRLCKLAKRNKATTYRYLQALEHAGFVEQNPVTRHYRLGPVVLQLAQTRESTVPRMAGAETVLTGLSDATGETSHVSVLSGTGVYSLTSCESQRHGTRAIVDIQSYPLHATASGLCALAYGPPDLIGVAQANLQAFTANTLTTAEDLARTVRRVRETGFAQSDRTFENETCSVAAPLFDHAGLYAGAVAVASVATRFTPELEQIIKAHLVTASRNITRNWGGNIPASIEAVWARSTSPSHRMEAEK